ncbi:hypothetical protein OKA05_14305 [Luteolibacter arcticus]|uniref:Uncharacterized protein n=1 Tax=Luteolibacter arcticus TaxID=1581411 RepID=A0ABT3GJR9_9BACT|nr:hypothetical protein [Luteolibacter arcticus]MCW1923735.1 hypothetical protein [Luteolibacter arcticus]
MFLRRLIPALAALILPLTAEPLPEGHFVDFIVVPVGPVPLAEFEKGAAPAAGGQGSGVQVKEVDPTEVPPNAVYVKKGNTTYQIPCFLNAIGTPVRTPVADTEVTLQIKTGTAVDAMTSLEKCVVPADARCVLVLLTKPLGEKKWTKPTVTFIPVPQSQVPQILVANASMAASCGAVFEGATKILLPPLKRHVWKPAPGKAQPNAAVALAMNGGGKFLPSLYEDRLTLAKGSTSILIAYEVTAQESFRGGKYAASTVPPGEFRPATEYPEKKTP